MGSKARFAKEILPLILAGRTVGQTYVEPFVGGFNMIQHVENPRIANDSHFYLIELFRAIQGGWIPPDEVTESEYKLIKSNPENYHPKLVGFVGFGCSYAGKWFGGYARGNANNGATRNYCLESKRNILKQAPLLNGVEILNQDYTKLDLPPHSLIYCDPPYANTTKYKHTFDSSKFWGWVRTKAKEGHCIFVSEYSAPSDFHSIWERTTNNTLVKETGQKQGTEHLWIPNE